MQRWMRKAGIPDDKAVDYEKSFKFLELTERDIQKTRVGFLGFFMNSSMRHAAALKYCMGKALIYQHNTLHHCVCIAMTATSHACFHE